ncbi:MAG: hypothetical protein U5L08_07295 [Xanthomonadales bacterium]|nr:hypothetical protein [Xanthomonadales bacterium]
MSEHIAAERANQPKRQRDQTWLFSDLSARPIPTEQHRRLVNQVAKVVLGHALRWHALRHRWVCNKIVHFTLGTPLDCLAEAIDLSEEAEIDTPDTDLNQLLQFPREAAQISAQIGHSRIRTTLLSYYHLPWSFQLQQLLTDVPEKPRVDRVACALGISKSEAYRRLSESNSSDARLVASEIVEYFGGRDAPTREPSHSSLLSLRKPTRTQTVPGTACDWARSSHGPDLL